MTISNIQQTKYGIKDIFTTAWTIYSHRISAILGVILIVYIPINIVIGIISVGQSADEFGPSLIQILVGLFGIIATMGIAYLVEQFIFGAEVTYAQALRKSLSRWASAIGTEILAGLIILGLALLLIVPGIIWLVYYYFSVYVVVLRNLGGKEALDYSKSIVQGQWWRVVGIAIVIGIVSNLLSLLLGMVFDLLAGSLVLFAGSLVVFIVAESLFDMVGAFFTVTFVVFFLNMDYMRNPAIAAGGAIQPIQKAIETPALETTPLPAAPAPQGQPDTSSVPAAQVSSDPQIALAEGKTLLSQGKRDEAVAHLMHAFREGSPEIRREASRVLEELGEMKAF